ncbi:MAG: hypothetical protein R2795_15110 [Saprospiraceae bacterium]
MATWLFLVGVGSVLSASACDGYDDAGAATRIFNTSRINTPDLEFCPALYENGLVFVSRYKSGPIDPKTGETYFELFYAELDPNGMPGNQFLSQPPSTQPTMKALFPSTVPATASFLRVQIVAMG